MLTLLPRLALALALAILGVLAYKLLPGLLAPAGAAWAQAPIRCHPAEQPCEAMLPGNGRVVVRATPNPIRPLQPFTLSVQLTGVQARQVDVDFDGVDMRMGIHRIRLTRSEQSATLFTGQGMLPICVSGRMLWSANVLIDTPSGPYIVPFHFELPAH